MLKGKKPKLDPNTTDTLVGEGTLFEGRIQSEAGIRIEGQVTGDLESQGDVIIGEKGVARSNITSRDVIIAGKVFGNVSCLGRLVIRPTGQLLGNTNAPSLIIDEGGVFQGMSRMESAATAAEELERKSTETAEPAVKTAEAKAASAAPFGGTTVIL